MLRHVRTCASSVNVPAAHSCSRLPFTSALRHSAGFIGHSTPAIRVSASLATQMADQAEAQQQQILQLLADAHAHPQLDPANMHRIMQLKCCQVAAMSVSYDVDWEIMQQLHQLAGSKVIPSFGIHPWWSHLHASTEGDTWQQLLEAPTPEQLQQAIDILQNHDPVTNSGAYATNRPDPPASSGTDSSSIHSGDSAGQFAGVCGVQPPQQQHEEVCLGLGLRVVPQQEWEGRLRQLLSSMPGAVVGEIGIDRAAQIPGSKAKTKLQHQLKLLEMQVAIAAEFQRPVSIHCVRGYGHLLQLFQQLAKQPSSCPPKVMLHSYGGSVEEVPRFCNLKGIGERFYFSFSHAINHRTPDKLMARIAAVPDDRLLLESDQVTPLVIDAGMLQICRIVAEVKGWGLQETAQRMLSNFKAFYGDQM